MNTKKIKMKWIILGIVLVIVVFAITFGSITFIKYRRDITQSDSNGQTKEITIGSGENINSAAKKLEEEDIIVSATSFKIYTVLNKKTQLVAGDYDLSSTMTIPEVADLLNVGQQAKNFNITFLPGGTVDMAKAVLKKQGFEDEEIETALAKDYSADFPQLFAGKPADADLEGYMFGETYNFEEGAKVEDILKRAFTEMQKYITSLKLEEKFKAQGLNLYEGITLASIVQKEMPSGEDQKGIAGVFYNRLRSDMVLGSDVTYQYIADKTGVARDTNLDSPYNLRVNTGLTPTPIAAPGVSAMKAVADPDKNDYYYFLSGDDDVTYFAETYEQHDQNRVDHCQKKCQIL